MATPKALRALLPNPVETVAELDKYIIGQAETKKVLANMLLSRALIKLRREGIIDSSVTLEKSNALLIGSTGVGKTAIMKALGKIANTVVTIIDVSSITSSGYVGDSPTMILEEHLENCYEKAKENKTQELDYYDPYSICKKESDLDIVETGIIYLDEVDKLAKRKGEKEITGFGDKVQSELLKYIEGTDVRVYFNGMYKNFSTSDIFFVCGGAFSGLSEIIKRRSKDHSGIGFSSEVYSVQEIHEAFKLMTTKDLVEYGLKPEFLGRLPLRSVLRPMTEELLIKIIKEPNNSILSQYQSMFNLFGVSLEIEEEALRLIAAEALKLKSGARSLKTIFNQVLDDAMFNIFSITEERFIVTKKLVEEKYK